MTDFHAMPARQQQRARPSNCLTGACGYSVIELLAVLSILAIITGIAMPQYRAGRLQINVAQRLLIANLRLARTNAISKSIHYQVGFPSASQVTISRMTETPPGSGTWLVDTASVQTIAVPSPATLKSDVVGTVVEFNSRGLALNLTTPLQIDTQDTFGMTKSIQVWPSGQVNEL